MVFKPWKEKKTKINVNFKTVRIKKTVQINKNLWKFEKKP